MSNTVRLEVVYGTPVKQTLLTVELSTPVTIQDAINESGIKLHHPEIDLSIHKVGIWNRAAKLDTPCQDGDRIEIYRPLIADPKEVRRQRAERAKAEGRADAVTGGRRNPQRKQRAPDEEQAKPDTDN